MVSRRAKHQFISHPYSFFKKKNIQEKLQSNLNILSDYSQNALMKKIDLWYNLISKKFKNLIRNFYIKDKFVPLSIYELLILLKAIDFKKKIIKSHNYMDGYCHGLTLTWLYFIKIKKHYFFYKLIKKIIDCPLEQIINPSNTKLIYTLLKYVEYAQWPQIHHPHKISQLEMVTIAMGEKAQNIITSLDELKENFDKLIIVPTMITISINFPYLNIGHTIGMFCGDGNIYIYDSRYLSGEAKIFNASDTENIFDELGKILFNSNKIYRKYPLYLNYAQDSPHYNYGMSSFPKL